MSAKTAEALENHFKSQRARPTPDGPLWEALWLLRLGRKEEARAVRSRWEATPRAGDAGTMIYATVLLEFGEDDRAFALLKEEIEQRRRFLPWLKMWPEMGKWKNDPRFKALVAMRHSP